MTDFCDILMYDLILEEVTLNQQKLDAAISSGDLYGVLEAWQTALGLPEPYASDQIGQAEQAATNINWTNLHNAYNNNDIFGVLEAMRITRTGIIPPQEATAQWAQGETYCVELNQNRLDIAIQNSDVEAILESLSLAYSGIIPDPYRTQQIEQALNKLADLQVTPSLRITVAKAPTQNALSGAESR